ncbi:SAM-dependent methyltransferase [Luteococcus sanguinis]|uniref:SAM-dependent methyltransferase n=1 Tax=Luteococcus sanguinis TaxID=174038 RepID=A0ABW1X096_9ACTN
MSVQRSRVPEGQATNPQVEVAIPELVEGAPQPAVTRIRVLGMGMGPRHVTPEVSEALRDCSCVVALDKSATPGAHAGDARDEQLAVRQAVADAHGVPVVVVPDPPRDRNDPTDYRAAVADWHAARVEALASALHDRAGTVALLAWGDPSLYDSMIRLAEQLADRLSCDWDVLPGISAPQLLAARHKIVLHRVGEPVHITTARRLPEALAQGQRNVLVMLTGARVLDELAVRPELTGWQLWWSANLGAAGERNVSGVVPEAVPLARTARAEALAADGWVMDLFLLRAPGQSS